MKHRIAYIDGLRAVAVLSVVVHHAAKYDLSLPLGVVRHALLEGAHGVDLFFVISGFCLSYPTLAALRTTGAGQFDGIRYWARRFVRILPPFWIALALFSVGAVALTAAKFIPPSPAWVAPQSWADAARQALLLDPTTVWANGSFWSLAVEFRWYIVFPALLALWIRAPRAFAAVGLASFAAFHLTRLSVWDFATLPAFMLGIIAADVHLRSKDAWRWAVPGFVLSIAAAVAFEPKVSDGFYQQTQVGWQLASFFFVVATGSVRALGRVLSAYPLAAVGLASYSIYLVHEPIIAFLQYYGGFSMIAAAAVAVTIGFLFWRVFERPVAEGDLRDAVVARVESPTNAAFRWLGVPSTTEFRLPEATLEPQEAVKSNVDERSEVSLV